MADLCSIRFGADKINPHLRKVKVHEAEREELEADGEAVEQPKGKRSQSVGRDKVPEVEGEEHGAQRRPQQAQEQEHGLVAEAFVSVPKHQPELDVDEDEEQGVEHGVDHRQAQGDVWRHGRAQGRQRHGLIHQRRLLPLHRCLHAVPGRVGGCVVVVVVGAVAGGRGAAEGPLPASGFHEAGLSSLSPGRADARVNAAADGAVRARAVGRRKPGPAAEPQAARGRRT